MCLQRKYIVFCHDILLLLLDFHLETALCTLRECDQVAETCCTRIQKFLFFVSRIHIL